MRLSLRRCLDVADMFCRDALAAADAPLVLHIEPPPQSAQDGASGQCGAEPAGGADGLDAVGWESDSSTCAWDPAHSGNGVGAAAPLAADDEAEDGSVAGAANAAASAQESGQQQPSGDSATADGHDGINPVSDEQHAQDAAAAAAQHQQLSLAAMAAARHDAAAAAASAAAEAAPEAEAASEQAASAAPDAEAAAAGTAAGKAAAGMEDAGAEAGAGVGDDTQTARRRQNGRRPLRLELLIPPAAHPWVGERIIGGAGAGPAFMQLAQQVRGFLQMWMCPSCHPGTASSKWDALMFALSLEMDV